MKKLGKIFAIVSALLFATSMYFSCSNSADGNGDNKDTSKVETSEDTISFAGDEITILKASDISETVTSIKITVTNVTGTTTDKTWWFWANTDGGDGDSIAWISGKDAAGIYELTITDATKIAYIKENGLAIKGSVGLSAKVTTTQKVDTPNGNDDNDNNQTGNGGTNNGNTNDNNTGGSGDGNNSSNTDAPDSSDNSGASDDNTGEENPTPSSGAITASGIDYEKLGIKVKASATAFPQSFVRGFDASTVYAIEGAGMEYLDADGKETDIFKMLKASGVNMIRLRIWNDPSQDTTASKQGNNNLEVTKALAKRVTDAGMEYMLDFHFSDTWADPKKQICPAEWSTIDTVDEMKTAIAEFVESTLKALKDSAGLPAMVQLGNECEGGILLTADDAVKADLKTETGSANFTTYINAAAEKVRAADENIKIVMHASRGGNTSVVNNFIKNTSGIKYCDYIGLSYYPFFTSHYTLENLKTNIKAITAAGKKAIISETSFCWTCDWVSGKCDNENNQLWYYSGNDGLVQAAKSLVDSSGSLVMGLTTTTKDGYTVIAPTVQNQYNAVAAVMEAAAQAGADGVIYWGGDWITNSAGSVPSAMENQAFWDYDHKILDSVAVFSYGTSASNTAANSASTGGGSTGSGTLAKDFALSNITSTAPGITVLEGSEFKALSTSNKIMVIITYNTSATTTDGYDPWYCYTIDGANWKGDFAKADGKASITITGADIMTLQSGSLTIYGNNADATVTVTYE